MRLLLDTHILVWWLTDAPSLPARIRPLIVSHDNIVFVSAASCWEVAIKVRSGKWSEAAGLVPGIRDVLTRARLTPLAVTVSHAERAGLLGTAHKDPFDRLLAAQAQSFLTEPMMSEMTAVGGLLLVGLSISSLLELRPIRVGNFLPALLVAPLIVAILAFLGVG